MPADIFTLASRFSCGMAYADAIAHGLPVIEQLRALFEHGTTGRWFDSSAGFDDWLCAPRCAALSVMNERQRRRVSAGLRRGTSYLARVRKNIFTHVRVLCEGLKYGWRGENP
jgi:hypothetical protein